MDAFVTSALVLREVKYNDADRMLTLLTPEHGVISASAKGSLRLKNKLFSACGLFCYSEFKLLPGKSVCRVEEASVKNVFHGLSSSIEGMALAMYLAEIAMSLSPSGQESDKLLRLLLNSFYLLSEKKCSVAQVKAVFELRAMSECGFLPQLLCCKKCGKYDGQSFYFDVTDGYLLCEDCANAEHKTTNLNEGSLFAVRHICLVEDKKVFSFQISPVAQHFLAVVAEQYALIHLDKPLKSYTFLKTLL
ncbi:MAG: DNA repair protein RecO [Faecalibacterium sp.]